MEAQKVAYLKELASANPSYAGLCELLEPSPDGIGSLASAIVYTTDDGALWDEHPMVKELKSSHPGFVPECVLSINNPLLGNIFQAREHIIKATNGGDSNSRVMYHTTRANLVDIVREGLDARYSQRGFFGRALYLTDDLRKANDYSPFKGKPEEVRAIIRCRVALGKIYKYGIGQFNRDLVVPPKGFNSVEGFIRRAQEFAVYDNTQVFVTDIALYTFTDTAAEMTPPTAVPPGVTGKVVFITAHLSDFFGRLRRSAGEPDSVRDVAVKALINKLLRKEVTPAEFVSNLEVVLKAPAPPELVKKIEAELAKCSLPSPPKPTVDTPTPAPALAPEDAQASGTAASPEDIHPAKKAKLDAQ